MTDDKPSEYQRGVDMGVLDQRLSNHDKQFNHINGSMERIASEFSRVRSEMIVIRLAIQRLADGAVNRDATVLTTAAALKDAEDARRQSGEQRWTPISRTLAIVAALVGVVGLIAYFILSR